MTGDLGILSGVFLEQELPRLDELVDALEPHGVLVVLDEIGLVDSARNLAVDDLGVNGGEHLEVEVGVAHGPLRREHEIGEERGPARREVDERDEREQLSRLFRQEVLLIRFARHLRLQPEAHERAQ